MVSWGCWTRRALGKNYGKLKEVCAVLSRFSRVQLFATPWTVARQAPLSLGFSRQEYWSGWPFPSPGDLPIPGIRPTSLTPPTLTGSSLPLTPPEKPYELQLIIMYPCWFFHCDKGTLLSKNTFTLGETRCAKMGTLYYLCKFSINLKLF